MTNDINDKIFLGTNFELEHRTIRREIASKVIFDRVKSKKIGEAKLIQLLISHIFWSLELLTLVKVLIYLLYINPYLLTILYYLHLLQYALNLINIQHISPIFVSMQESHHRLCFKRIKLIQSIVVYPRLPNKHHQSYFEQLLLVFGPKGKCNRVQRLSIQY